MSPHPIGAAHLGHRRFPEAHGFKTLPRHFRLKTKQMYGIHSGATRLPGLRRFFVARGTNSGFFMVRLAAHVATLSALAPQHAISRIPSPARWGIESLAGHLTELSGLGPTARLSLAVSLICEAQHSGEVAAWVTNRRSTFFPPDATKSGADLSRLPVVFTPDAPAAARAVWRLVQSGGFGLVVADLVGTAAEVPIPLQSRLTSAAQAHGAAIVFVTEKAADRASLGSLVSLRCEAHREAADGGRFLCTARALKDKRRGPGWTYTEVRRGPAGLR